MLMLMFGLLVLCVILILLGEYIENREGVLMERINKEKIRKP